MFDWRLIPKISLNANGCDRSKSRKIFADFGDLRDYFKIMKKYNIEKAVIVNCKCDSLLFIVDIKRISWFWFNRVISPILYIYILHKS